MSFAGAVIVVAISGFLSLSYEILWYRAFSFVSGGMPWVFGRVLAAFLVGLAQGAYVSRRFVRDDSMADTARQLRAVAAGIAGAALVAYLVIPGLAWLAAHHVWQGGFLLVVAAAFAMGLILPLTSHLGIAPDARAGARLSYLYLANIIGSALGSLVTGFVLTDLWSVETISLALGIVGLLLGGLVAIAAETREPRETGPARTALQWHGSAVVAATVAVATILSLANRPLFSHLYERLLYKGNASSMPAFSEVVETRGGVIAVTPASVVYGGGVYDGMIETNIVRDSNLLVRAYALGAMHPRPSRVLMIGLGTGAWAHALLALPGVEHVTAVEINAGYLRIIARHAEVRGILRDRRMRIVIDDGRRWMAQHQDEKFDAIVMNTSWFWRAHATNLLSREFMQLARHHLRDGGILYFNTTWSPDVMKTALSTYPYGMRCLNFIAVSDAPFTFHRDRWQALLRGLRRDDGRLAFDDSSAGTTAKLDSLLALGRSLDEPPLPYGLERREAVLRRVASARIVTDDNMRVEWRPTPPP